MIYLIAAIDSKNGLADEEGIPWQGKIPGDVRYFRKMTLNKNVLMGYNTYIEFKKPLPERSNYVATKNLQKLKPGFTAVKDARKFLEKTREDIWVIGGAGLFADIFDLADQIYLTRVEGNYKCTKFFPLLENDFKLTDTADPIIENGVKYKFEKWIRKN